MAYVAASDYIEYAGISSDYDSDTGDVLFTNLIARAQKSIETYTGRVFQITSTDEEATRTFDYGSDVDNNTLYLDADLAYITSMTLGDSDATAVTTDQYVLEPRNDGPYYAIKLLSSASVDWTYSGDEEVGPTILGFWGYSTDPPDDIKHATLRLTKFYDDQRKSGADVDRPIRTSEGLTIMPSKLPNDVRQLIDEYKRRRVGGIG